MVDVGCGPGATTASLAELYDCWGVDPSPEAVRLARARFPEVRFVEGGLPDGLDGMGSPDAIVLMDVLEHLEDDATAVRSLVAALPAGGLLLVTVPADPSLWSGHDETMGHHRRYTAESLRLTWAGLPVEELLLSPFNSRLRIPIRLVRGATRLTRRPWGEDGSDVRDTRGPLNGLLLRTFEGEAKRLRELAAGNDVRPYRRGTSLVALLRRTDDA